MLPGQLQKQQKLPEMPKCTIIVSPRLKRHTRRFVRRQRAHGVVYPAGYCTVRPKRCITRHKRLFRLWMKAIFAKKRKQKHIAEELPNSEDEKDESEYEKEGAGEYLLNDGFLVSDESLEYVEHAEVDLV